MKIYHVVLLVLLAMVLSANIFSSQTMMTLKLVEHAETDAVTDTSDEGDSVGDILTFANPVYDKANITQLGTDNGYCFRTAVSAAWECAWTLILSDGQITVQGPFNDAGDSMLAITGGTGAYAGASGQMTLHDRNGDATEYDFTYEISQ